MDWMKRQLRNRDFILILGLGLGLLWGEGAHWTHPLTLPLLAVAMTVSVMGIPAAIFRTPRSLVRPALSGIAITYLLLSGVILGLSSLFIHDKNLWNGFVLIAAVPPGVAVIPFTFFLNGNSLFSLVGTIGAYLGALIITPLFALGFLGTAFIHPVKLFIILVELILLPLICIPGPRPDRRFQTDRALQRNDHQLELLCSHLYHCGAEPSGLPRPALLPFARRAYCPCDNLSFRVGDRKDWKAFSNRFHDAHKPCSPWDNKKLRARRWLITRTLQHGDRCASHRFNHLYDRLHHLVRDEKQRSQVVKRSLPRTEEGRDGHDSKGPHRKNLCGRQHAAMDGPYPTR